MKAENRGGGQSHRTGFTLIEVIIALAVFGFLIGSLLAFLPWAVEGVGKIRDYNVAYGLPDAISVELERIGYGKVEFETRGTDPSGNARALKLVASATGDRIEHESTSAIPLEERYFLVECRRFTSGQLTHDPSNGYLALQVDVQWPYLLPDPSQSMGVRSVQPRIRQHFRYSWAVTRGSP